MTATEARARYIAEHALQAEAAGDLVAADLLLRQAQAIDPEVVDEKRNAMARLQGQVSSERWIRATG